MLLDFNRLPQTLLFSIGRHRPIKCKSKKLFNITMWDSLQHIEGGVQ